MFENVKKAKTADEVKESLLDGENGVLMGDVLVTGVKVRGNALLVYTQDTGAGVLHNPSPSFAGVIVGGKLYTRHSMPCFDGAALNLDVVLEKTRMNIVRTIRKLYEVTAVPAETLQPFDYPLAKQLARKLLTGEIKKRGNVADIKLSSDEALPVLMGLQTVEEAATKYFAENQQFYAWHKAMELKAEEFIHNGQAGDETWYRVFNAVNAAGASTLWVELKHGGRKTKARFAKSDLLKLLARGNDAVITADDFITLDVGLKAMKELYGCTQTTTSVLTLSNIESISVKA